MNPFDRDFSNLMRQAEEMKRLQDQLGMREVNALSIAAERAAELGKMIDMSFIRTHVTSFSSIDHSLHSAIERIANEAGAAQEAFRQFDLYNDRFKNLVPENIGQIASSFASLESVKALTMDSVRLTGIAESMANIKSPWIDIHNAAQSLASASELHALAAGIADLTPFGETLAGIVRADLGDWRSVATFPESVFTDPVARFDFYRDLGFNDALTDFPAPAFNELLHSSGLRPAAWPEAERGYGADLVIVPDEEQDGEVPISSREAYDIIYRLETRLRDFIDREMTKVFGKGWEKRQTPTGMYQDWMEKKKLALAAGQPDYPLIAYADFSHYQQLIERGDNWIKVFATVFARKTDIQESFTRLGPVRVCAMHCRIITPDDQLILNAEAQRIFRALGFRI